MNECTNKVLLITETQICGGVNRLDLKLVVTIIFYFYFFTSSFWSFCSIMIVFLDFKPQLRSAALPGRRADERRRV